MKKARILLSLCMGVCAAASAGTVGSFIVANNDVPAVFPPVGPSGSTVTFYALGANGAAGARTVVATGGVGAGGGSFAISRIAIVPQSDDVCVFASNGATDDISAISATSLALLATYPGSRTDSGAANGIGLVANSNYLYATFSSSSTIATFAIQPGCVLRFVGDVFTVGLNSGVVGGMALHGAMMVASYGDGSIESFNVAGGAPVSNGDVQNSTGSSAAHLPNGVDITTDGHFAVFGDASTVSTVEISDISSGRLTPTMAYDVGSSWNSGNVTLTPDESFIIVTNGSGGAVTAAPFDKTSGKVSTGCTSGPLTGFYDAWSYAGAATLQQPTGHGGLIYVPEFGSTGYSSIGLVRLIATGSGCALREVPGSPIVDNTDLSNLLSIGIYPARPLQ